MKKYKLPEDAFDEISLQKHTMMKSCTMPTEVYISNDVWQLIKKSNKKHSVKISDKIMDLRIFLASSPVSFLVNYIKVV